jgi:predicted DNA-binding ribbon-helix-helix protein
MKMTDLIIRELWKIKDTIAREHDCDIDSLVADLKKRRRPKGQRVVNLQAEAAGHRQEAPRE